MNQAAKSPTITRARQTKTSVAARVRVRVKDNRNTEWESVRRGRAPDLCELAYNFYRPTIANPDAGRRNAGAVMQSAMAHYGRAAFSAADLIAIILDHRTKRGADLATLIWQARPLVTQIERLVACRYLETVDQVGFVRITAHGIIACIEAGLEIPESCSLPATPC